MTDTTRTTDTTPLTDTTHRTEHHASKPSLAEADPAAADAFAGRLLEVINGGFLTLMVSIGHRTRLFDVLSTLHRPTSERLAAAAELDERYVREWLGAMVAGGLVRYRPQDRTYDLPPEHAAFLTRAAGPDNLASLTQMLGLLAGVEEQVVDVFRRGGGVPYSEFPRFHALMAEESRAVFEATLVHHTVPLVPGLQERLQEGIDVMDLGCGQGYAMMILGEHFPNSRFLGVDLSPEAIGHARDETHRRGLPNVRFEIEDAAKLAGEADFDFITAFDAIHDQAQPRQALAAIRSRLRPEGTFLLVDIAASSDLQNNLDNPLAPFLYTVSTMHCTTVSLAQGGEGLGAVWGEEKARELLAEAGFGDVQVRHVDGDMLNAYFICRP